MSRFSLTFSSKFGWILGSNPHLSFKLYKHMAQTRTGLDYKNNCMFFNNKF